jgi:outer membrane protein assembly factor BamB
MFGVVLALVVLGGAVGHCDWTTFRHDAARSGMGDKPIAALPALGWRAQLGGSVDGSPIVAAGAVYVGTNHGIFACVDAVSGAVRWRASVDGAIASAAALSGDRILVCTGRGFLYCLSTGGDVLWRAHAWDAAVGSPLVAGGTCFWGTMDGVFHATSVADGLTTWQVNLAGGVSSACASDGRRLYVSDEGGSVWALAPEDGKVVWTRATGCPGMAAPVVAGGQLVVPLVTPTRLVPPKVSYLLTLDCETGALLSQVSGSRSIFASPVVANSRVAYASVEGYLSDTLLRCVDLGTGVQTYERRLGGVVDSSPAWVGDLAYFGAQDGCLYTTRLSDGMILGRTKLAPKIFSSPALDGGALYVGASDGYLYCLRSGAPQ